MPGMTKKSFAKPDDTRSPDKTLVQTVSLGAGVEAARMTLEPGWRWSQCIGPIAGTERCQVHHVGAMLSGQLHLSCDDGTEADIGPGDAYVIEPGHDAWVVGDLPVVAYEFDSAAAASYATPGS
jgi:mannose-6-phosphate isomerase-like protein (cupin superfamily)